MKPLVIACPGHVWAPVGELYVGEQRRNLVECRLCGAQTEQTVVDQIYRFPKGGKR